MRTRATASARAAAVGRARRGQARQRPRPPRRAGGRRPPSRRVRSPSSPSQPFRLERRALAVLDDGRLVLTVSRSRRVDDAEPLLDRGDRAADRGSTRLGQAAHLRGDVGQFRLEPRQPFGDAVRSADRRGRPSAPRAAPRRSSLGHRARSAVSASWTQRRAAGDRFAVLRGGQPAAELVRLAGPERGRVDLVRLVIGQLEPSLQLVRARSPARPAPPGSRARRSTAARHRLARLASCPPYASSRSRCQRSSSSRCCSCWPWISTSGPISSARRAAVTVSSSSRAVDRPFAATSRTAMQRLGQAIEQRLHPRRVGTVPDQRRIGAAAADAAPARR